MDSDNVITITSSSQWKKHVVNKKSRHPRVVVDFVASWCPPCRVMAPIVKEIAQAYPDVCIVKVDVDKQRGIATACGIQQMPTFQFYFEGEKVNSLLGADKDRLEAAIKELLAMETTREQQEEGLGKKKLGCFGGMFQKVFGSAGSSSSR